MKFQEQSTGITERLALSIASPERSSSGTAVGTTSRSIAGTSHFRHIELTLRFTLG